MVETIYTVEALNNATPQGFPARSRGTRKLKREKVLPRLHPDGRDALLGECKLTVSVHFFSTSFLTVTLSGFPFSRIWLFYSSCVWAWEPEEILETTSRGHENECSIYRQVQRSQVKLFFLMLAELIFKWNVQCYNVAICRELCVLFLLHVEAQRFLYS